MSSASKEKVGAAVTVGEQLSSGPNIFKRRLKVGRKFGWLKQYIYLELTERFPNKESARPDKDISSIGCLTPAKTLFSMDIWSGRWWWWWRSSTI